MTSPVSLEPHPDRLLPADPGVRAIARRLDEATAREVWRHLCAHREVYRGTPVRYWLESELADIFEVSARPSAQTADNIYDQIVDRLAKEAYRPLALYERFGIAMLATTDDPCDDLAAHTALAGPRVVAEHRLDEDEAHEIALDLVTTRPRAVFTL